MEYFIQQLVNGITLGSIYGLIAIGYTMVYGIIGMINFEYVISGMTMGTGDLYIKAPTLQPYAEAFNKKIWHMNTDARLLKVLDMNTHILN